MQSILPKLVSVTLLLFNLASADDQYVPAIDIVPAVVSNLSSTVEFVSKAEGFDSPKVIPINASTYEWWYFDAVSEDQGYSIVITFLNAPMSAFPFSGAPPTGITEASISISTPENPVLVTEPIPAIKAVVVSVGNGASGFWEGSGFAFAGTPDMKFYELTIDSPQVAIKGIITLKSSAPAHYPCGPVEAGQSMLIMPHVGWANAVPDAEAHVDLTVNGTNVKFSGRGYHDKNWGDTPFGEVVASWNWGHGRLGPYSIVWYDALTTTNVEYVSGYVTRHGKVIAETCALSNVKVRPTGATDKYPPLSSSPSSGNIHVEIDLGSEGTMAFNVVPRYHVANEFGLYDRWTGSLSGGIVGKKTYNGTALYEQFSVPS